MRSPKKLITAAAAAVTLVFPLVTPVCTFAEFSVSQAPAYEIYASDSFSSQSQAASYLREQLQARASTVSITIPKGASSAYDTIDELFSEAMAETGSGTQGDYIRFGLKSYNCTYSSTSSNYKYSFELKYFTTAAQEAELTQEVDKVLDSLDLDGKSDYEKITAVYDFMVTNITYAEDFSDEIIYSSYGAMINKVAVCQGYAQLLYRMLNDSGISCRVIAGTSNGENHTWNIAEIDGLYYLLDSTWDSTFKGKSKYYFLKGSKDFDSYSSKYDHTAGMSGGISMPDYTSAEFAAEYPISEYAYDPTAVPSYTLGDIDDNGVIDGIDASAALTAYSLASTGKSTGFTTAMTLAADADENDIVDGLDASYILSYYAMQSTGKSYSSLREYIKSLK